MGALNISFCFCGFDNASIMRRYRHLQRTTCLQLTRSSCRNIDYSVHDSRNQIVRFLTIYFHCVALRSPSGRTALDRHFRLLHQGPFHGLPMFFAVIYPQCIKVTLYFINLRRVRSIGVSSIALRNSFNLVHGSFTLQTRPVQLIILLVSH